MDITDLYDPTTVDPEGGFPLGERVRDLMGKELTDPRYLKKWDSNNRVVVVVSNEFVNGAEAKVFLGVQITDPADQEYRDITTHILDKAGYTQADMYVPMAYDSDKSHDYVLDVFVKAIEEIQQGGERFKEEVTALLGIGDEE